MHFILEAVLLASSVGAAALAFICLCRALCAVHRWCQG